MPLPYAEPRAVVVYIVCIDLEEARQFQAADTCSKAVADCLHKGKSVAVEFKNASNVDLIRQNFNIRVDDWLRKLGHNSGFGYESSAVGATYRPK